MANVLVCEDEPRQRALWGQALRQVEVDHRLTASLLEAYDSLHHAQFDILFLDLNHLNDQPLHMHIQDCRDLAGRVRDMCPGTPIIGMSVIAHTFYGPKEKSIVDDIESKRRLFNPHNNYEFLRRYIETYASGRCPALRE